MKIIHAFSLVFTLFVTTVSAETWSNNPQSYDDSSYIFECVWKGDAKVFDWKLCYLKLSDESKFINRQVPPDKCIASYDVKVPEEGGGIEFVKFAKKNSISIGFGDKKAENRDINVICIDSDGSRSSSTILENPEKVGGKKIYFTYNGRGNRHARMSDKKPLANNFNRLTKLVISNSNKDRFITISSTLSDYRRALLLNKSGKEIADLGTGVLGAAFSPKSNFVVVVREVNGKVNDKVNGKVNDKVNDKVNVEIFAINSPTVLHMLVLRNNLKALRRLIRWHISCYDLKSMSGPVDFHPKIPEEEQLKKLQKI